MKHIHTFESFLNEADTKDPKLVKGVDITIEMDDEDGDFVAGDYKVTGLTRGGVMLDGMGKRNLQVTFGALSDAGYTVNESTVNEGRVKATDKIIIPKLSDIDHTRIVKWCSANGIKDCEWEKSGDGYIMDTSKMPIEDQQDLDKYLFASRLEYTREFTK
jgi:hypothetical protein